MTFLKPRCRKTAPAFALIGAIIHGSDSSMAADPISSANGLISQLLEAGVVCSRREGQELGPAFYDKVVRDCVGRASCRVSPLDVATEKELADGMCTRFFVQFTCGTAESTELESRSLTDVLSPSCS